MRFWEYSDEEAVFRSISGGGGSGAGIGAGQDRRGEFAKSSARNRGDQESAEGSRDQVQAAAGPDGQARQGATGHPGPATKRAAEPDRRAGITVDGAAQAARIDAHPTGFASRRRG